MSKLAAELAMILGLALVLVGIGILVLGLAWGLVAGGAVTFLGAVAMRNQAEQSEAQVTTA